ncbi:uncharacterized protein LOC132281528 [Cornus florida]|uniref:uncharacterized protein LOC132281528 n=1 Tax=Cornus florida TaxID=4283 RepID=UPI00289896B9|nr:uncharacterized protein LOC132281528 [Cornus florida]
MNAGKFHSSLSLLAHANRQLINQITPPRRGKVEIALVLESNPDWASKRAGKEQVIMGLINKIAKMTDSGSHEMSHTCSIKGGKSSLYCKPQGKFASWDGEIVPNQVLPMF